MKRKLGIHSLFCLVMLIFVLSSCSDDDKNEDKISGVWTLQKITQDGEDMTLSPLESHLTLLIESNGVYRTFTTDGITSKSHYGAWSITDNKWLELTIDAWHLQKNPLSIKEDKIDNRWLYNHLLTRFTILSINDNQLEIRLKTFVGDKKYSALFVQQDRPSVNAQTLDGLINEFSTLKTYTFVFKKQN